jgi:uncharacterized protein (UPF0128 family)
MLFHIKEEEDEVPENAKKNNIKSINIEKKNPILKCKIDASDKKHESILCEQLPAVYCA